MALLRRVWHAPWTHKAVGVLGAEYLRLVWKTSRFVIEPPDIYERLPPQLPIIMAMWHGQHFMAPFTKPSHYRAKVLISRHRDGEVNAVAANRLGVGTIRGSGDPAGRFDRKGGVFAFRAMHAALKEGWNVALTADVPKNARVAGLGIVKLAQISGRLIYPVAVATSRRIVLNNWDRSTINLPFSRGAIVAGDPISVPQESDEDLLEAKRIAVEAGLNAVTDRAYAVVDRLGGTERG